MLVPTMTPEEIYAEIRKDANPLWDAISMRFGAELQRIVRRSQRFPLIKGYTWQSKNTKIEYNVVFIAYRKAERKFIPHFLVYTMYSYESGRNIVYIDNKNFAIRIYTPHFIQRYKERDAIFAQLDNDVVNQNAELFFLLKNYRVNEASVTKQLDELVTSPAFVEMREQEKQTRFWQDPDYERYSAACESGLCLCERNKANPNISIYNTFIAYDMLQGTQLIDFAQAVVPVVLDRLSLYYPRQKAVWQKEWNDFAASVAQNEKMDLFEKSKAVLEKLSELNKRYPINTPF